MNHFVNGKTLREPFPDHMQQAVFGLGCFWGAERIFWEIPGVITTAVGYHKTLSSLWQRFNVFPCVVGNRHLVFSFHVRKVYQYLQCGKKGLMSLISNP